MKYTCLYYAVLGSFQHALLNFYTEFIEFLLFCDYIYQIYSSIVAYLGYWTSFLTLKD